MVKTPSVQEILVLDKTDGICNKQSLYRFNMVNFENTWTFPRHGRCGFLTALWTFPRHGRCGFLTAP